MITKPTAKEIKSILAEHAKWLKDEGGSRADLSRANLSRADLSWADMSDADLSGANLSGANLSCANMYGANMSCAAYAVAVVLRQNWRELPPSLTLELMRHDAQALPDPDAMTKWAKGGTCPFAGRERDFYFQENKKLWKPGEPKLYGWALWEALAKANKIKITKDGRK